jgi:hypothetical protein
VLRNCISPNATDVAGWTTSRLPRPAPLLTDSIVNKCRKQGKESGLHVYRNVWEIPKEDLKVAQEWLKRNSRELATLVVSFDY